MPGLYFANSLWFMAAIFFIQGNLCATNTNCAFVYLMEFFPNEKQNAYNNIYQVLTNATMIFVTIYFWMIKSWLPITYVAMVFNVGAAITSFWIPESPKFLLR